MNGMTIRDCYKRLLHKIAFNILTSIPKMQFQAELVDIIVSNYNPDRDYPPRIQNPSHPPKLRSSLKPNHPPQGIKRNKFKSDGFDSLSNRPSFINNNSKHAPQKSPPDAAKKSSNIHVRVDSSTDVEA
ncbi:hypothetical protein QJS10_CPA02g00894 [Acorus calamus]|uniref:Uncharacterized protein n=1 Tax=Acorus calamus TaxID=4465 RepID=A0AAV9FEQ9_ACOCL|nr:hypothetical protein QJS10_CPA02g00894 [Acorus calamus]